LSFQLLASESKFTLAFKFRFVQTRGRRDFALYRMRFLCLRSHSNVAKCARFRVGTLRLGPWNLFLLLRLRRRLIRLLQSALGGRFYLRQFCPGG